MPDNVKSWQKGRRLLRLLGCRKSKRILLPQASPSRPLRPFPLTRKTPSSETLLGPHLLGSLEISPDPSFLIYQILTYSSSKN